MNANDMMREVTAQRIEVILFASSLERWCRPGPHRLACLVAGFRESLHNAFLHWPPCSSRHTPLRLSDDRVKRKLQRFPPKLVGLEKFRERVLTSSECCRSREGRETSFVVFLFLSWSHFNYDLSASECLCPAFTPKPLETQDW